MWWGGGEVVAVAVVVVGCGFGRSSQYSMMNYELRAHVEVEGSS
jgi:hypothetical protein